MTSKLRMPYEIKKIYSRVTTFCYEQPQMELYVKIMNLQSCKTHNSIIFKTPNFHLRILNFLNHFDVALVTNHKIYYMGENDASSLTFKLCKSSEFQLFMSGSYHHVVSTCTNKLVQYFQVNLSMNLHYNSCLSFISKFMHAFLTFKNMKYQKPRPELHFIITSKLRKHLPLIPFDKLRGLSLFIWHCFYNVSGECHLSF